MHLVLQQKDIHPDSFSHRVCPLSLIQGDIVRFIEHITGLFRITAQKKNLTIDFHTEQEELTLWYDRKLRDKVISNLLSNGIKFTGKEGIVRVSISHPLPFSEELCIWEWERKPSEEVVCITVKDTGPGIPEKDRPFVFEPFYQSDDTGPGIGMRMGAGIGLALAAEYVKLHYGHISV